MAVNTKILLAAIYVALMAATSSGQFGNRFIRRGFAQEFGQDVLDQGKYPSHVIHAYAPPNNGQGYNLGWNGYQAINALNPYQKLGYGYQSQGLNGGLGFMDGAQLFGVPQPVNFVGNQRLIRI